MMFVYGMNFSLAKSFMGANFFGLHTTELVIFFIIIVIIISGSMEKHEVQENILAGPTVHPLQYYYL